MKKRIILSLAAVAALALGVAGFSAFEAHIINVTAKISNALAVTPESIDYENAFPQELIHENLSIGLSESFIATDRVDDIEYRIVQKLRAVEDQAYTGPYEDVSDLAGAPADAYYPSLCAYLSKHKVDIDENQIEAEVDAFHNRRTWTGDHVMYDDIASGRLSKLEEDTEDNWDIDFAAPCFEGECAQDWPAWVASINDQVNPDDYIMDPGLKTQGLFCDLWVEITGISDNPVKSVVFDAEDLLAMNIDGIATKAEFQAGIGSWAATPDEDTNADGADKFEFYIDPYVASEGFIQSFTIDEIASISYYTNKPGAESAVDFYLQVYTAPDGTNDDAGWYGYRLNAEPYYSNNLNAPASTWNMWSTDPGTNQLTFFDSNRPGVGFGFYGQPALADLQATATFDWNAWYAPAAVSAIDYGSETVMYLNFSTGSAWSGTFDGYLDAIELKLTNGKVLKIDLEN